LSNETGNISTSGISGLVLGPFNIDPLGTHGGNRILFASELSKGALKTFINEKELKAASQTQIAPAAVSMEAGKLTSMKQISNSYGGGKNGGIKAPHIHYDGETYFLTDKQWNEFSKTIIKGFQNKLAHAKGINFDQLMNLSDVMSEIISDE
jgi:hypothetical protein